MGETAGLGLVMLVMIGTFLLSAVLYVGSLFFVAILLARLISKSFITGLDKITGNKTRSKKEIQILTIIFSIFFTILIISLILFLFDFDPNKIFFFMPGKV